MFKPILPTFFSKREKHVCHVFQLFSIPFRNQYFKSVNPKNKIKINVFKKPIYLKQRQQRNLQPPNKALNKLPNNIP